MHVHEEENARVLGRRRFLVRGLVGGGVAVAAGAGLIGLSGNAQAVTLEEFDEIYLKRHIKGWAVNEGVNPRCEATIDGDALHVMRNGDGTFTTSVNHYESFETLRDATRRAVETLGDLRPESQSAHHGR
ncbi:tyrosinase cofactor [Saccharothrix obliqua]|uniref:tyrosinase cofactor n=1 Tax=Saccharothrix obliqua TaxID=2861747 RepID=UPI001C5F4594|nr:tyrosinase cofactor [Saccharothrix obliqua]MBW4718585.1 tyrosinase cofactor [Saccharothrix obliqua]